MNMKRLVLVLALFAAPATAQEEICESVWEIMASCRDMVSSGVIDGEISGRACYDLFYKMMCALEADGDDEAARACISKDNSMNLSIAEKVFPACGEDW